jgi:enoyl-CoA hydratase
LHEELEQIWVDLNDDPDAEAVILTGAGKVFSAGGDAHGMLRGDFHPFDSHVFRKARRLIMNLLELEAPLICALNGDAIGGALTYALFCDMVIAERSARLGDPHVKVGVVAGDGSCVVWPLLCGPTRAKQYLMTGDLMSAEEAERIGLVNAVVDDGQSYEAAVRYAERLLMLPPLAVRWTKHSINRVLREQTHQILDTSLALEAVSILSEDHQEAVSAFLEKRGGAYHGR